MTRPMLTPERFGLHFDERRYLRMGLLVTCLGVGGGLAWSLLAPLNRGAPVPAMVVAAGHRQEVSSPIDGEVQSILVHDGQHVNAGDTVIALAPEVAEQHARSLSQRYYATLATLARLAAEQHESAEIHWPDALINAPHDARVDANEAMRTQQALFSSRRATRLSKAKGLEQSITAMRASLSAMQHMQTAQQGRAHTLDQQIQNLSTLASEGYVAGNRVLELHQSRQQLAGDRAQMRGDILSLQDKIASQQTQLRNDRDTFLQSVDTDMAEQHATLSSIDSDRASARYRVEHASVRSPVSGTVVGLEVHTRGAPLTTRQHLLDIVPEGEGIVIEGRLSVDLIDQVHVDMPVELQFTAFNQNSTPRLPGKVTMVGADRLQDPGTQMPYYPIKVELTPEGLREAERLHVRPGMQVQAFVITGNRSMMNYLLKPIMDRAHIALTES